MAESAPARFTGEGTPLGPREAWPERLQVLFDTIVVSSMPMMLMWGREGLMLYNGAYARVIGARHPEALGRSVYVTFEEARAALERLHAPLWAGEALSVEALPMPFARDGEKVVDAWFDASLSPIAGARGEVLGIFVVLQEVTDRVVAQRAHDAMLERLRREEERQRFVLEVADAQRELSDPVAVQRVTSQKLAERLGVERAMFYEFDPERGEGEVRVDYAAEGLPSLVGSYRADAFPMAHELVAGGPLVIADTSTADQLSPAERASFPALGLVAILAVPLVREGTLVATLMVASGEARDWTAAEVALAEDVAQRTWAAVMRGRAEVRRAEVEARQRTILENIPQHVWRTDPDGRSIWLSPQWEAYTGLSMHEAEERWRELIHPDDLPALLEARGARPWGELPPVEARLRHGATGAYRWFRHASAAVRDEGGRVLEFVGTSTDIDDIRRMQDRQAFLVAELQHRTRNLMGVVDAIAADTLETSESLEAFGTTFRGRLAALARVQSLLSRIDHDEAISLQLLLRQELEAISSSGCKREAVRLQGPEAVYLGFEAVQVLALAVHELATNAVKYGALAQDGGSLQVRWRVKQGAADDPRLCIEWTERLPSPVAASGEGSLSRGQGRELIEDGLPYQLNAETSWAMGKSGVECSLSLPAKHWSMAGATHAD